ncbi:MAG: hypothetical protein NTX50_11310 [Candidatus Sumerlaeota bacterium]|nr:hypothetical protein [Candidatus Sumerlaeota bacterium]
MKKHPEKHLLIALAFLAGAALAESSEKTDSIKPTYKPAIPDSDAAYRNLRALSGKELTAENLQEIGTRLNSRYWWMREPALEVIASCPSDKDIGAKTAMIMKSMQTIKDMPNVDYKRQPTVSGIHLGSEADNLYCRSIVALSKLPNADDEIKRYIASTTDTIIQQCLYITLGLRGDMNSARKAMKEFLLDERMGKWTNARLKALSAFENNGNMSDIEFLSHIAANDPYQQVNPYSEGYEMWRGEFVNLTKIAKDYGLAEAFTNANPPIPWDMTRHWTRHAAEMAIKAIKARQQNGK